MIATRKPFNVLANSIESFKSRFLFGEIENHNHKQHPIYIIIQQTSKHSLNFIIAFTVFFILLLESFNLLIINIY
jgi:hypothetical protein